MVQCFYHQIAGEIICKKIIKINANTISKDLYFENTKIKILFSRTEIRKIRSQLFLLVIYLEQFFLTSPSVILSDFFQL